MSPGEESGTDSSEEGSDDVDLNHVVVAGLHDLALENVEGEGDSGVERGSGVGSSNEDHGGEGRGDSKASHPAIVFSSKHSSGVLDDKVGHDEHEGAQSFDHARLEPRGLGFEDGECSNVGGVAFLNEAHVEEFHSEEASNDLCSNHVEELDESLQAPLVVDKNTKRDRRVVVGSSDGSSQKKKEEQSESNSDSVTVGGDDSTDKEESSNEFIQEDSGGVSTPSHAVGRPVGNAISSSFTFVHLKYF